MRPTDEQGVPLAKGNTDYEYNHNDRGYKLNKDGVLRFFYAFNETIKSNLEHDDYLSRLSVYLLGGDSLKQEHFRRVHIDALRTQTEIRCATDCVSQRGLQSKIA